MSHYTSAEIDASLPSRRALDRYALRLSDTVAGARELAPVLEAIAQGCAEAFDAVLARVWLLGPGDACATCALGEECAERTRCLHLRASAGLTARLDGAFRRFPIGARRVGQIALTLEPYVVRGDLSALGLAEASWLAVHRVRGFAALPLLFRDELLGVLAAFSRREWADTDAASLALAARLAANAIAAARAFEAHAAPAAPTPLAPRPNPAAGPAAAHLRPMAELERDAIVRVLEHTRWKVSGPHGAAALLRLPPSTLASRMLKLGIRRPPRP